jgi:transposase InsO family protein
VFNTFQNYMAFVENQISHKIKTLWSDNGNEFISNQFNKICAQNGITH